jgi:hypothetical protein
MFTRVPRRALAVLTTVVAVGGLSVAAEAAPVKPTTCFTKRAHSPRHWFCPLNKPNRIPVFAEPSLRDRVGFLTVGGTANWFRYQVRGDNVQRGTFLNALGRFENDWWAYTLADVADEPGKPAPMGYVSETYFSGGGDVTHDPARGLPVQ